MFVKKTQSDTVINEVNLLSKKRLVGMVIYNILRQTLTYIIK